MTKFDMWYGDNPADADRVTCFFSDADCVYRGNFYKGRKCIGDFTATDSVELEKRFAALGFVWRWEA